MANSVALERKLIYLTYIEGEFLVWRTCISRGTFFDLLVKTTMSEQWLASCQHVLISVTSVWPLTSVLPAGWAATISGWLKDTAINEWFPDSRDFWSAETNCSSCPNAVTSRQWSWGHTSPAGPRSWTWSRGSWSKFCSRRTRAGGLDDSQTDKKVSFLLPACSRWLTLPLLVLQHLRVCQRCLFLFQPNSESCPIYSVCSIADIYVKSLLFQQ